MNEPVTGGLTEHIVALAAYCIATSITPGPNNMILAASGATFGFRRTLPNMAGIIVGFIGLVFLAGIGGESLMRAVPLLAVVLKWAGMAYLLYLAWKIGTAGRAEAGTRSRPLSFWQATAFQFINPKGLAMAISSHATFRIPELGEWGSILTVTGMFLFVGMPCTLVWALFGQGVGRWLRDDRRLRLFNAGLGLATAASALLLLVS
ncbi:LysE family transporter [Niveispirillum sp. BGYR6]|uniref:LysE family translocator n=1 Tax=Niveispirillum sp. BGYR6 TaxID=2971249 RepID=UPI0022B9C459|nr:LysE family transporter [Niveispirillum sp. BGYR6]MDG5494224.1 LysE family transporter [Niveispirillum sp. BGYR6]